MKTKTFEEEPEPGKHPPPEHSPMVSESSLVICPRLASTVSLPSDWDDLLKWTEVSVPTWPGLWPAPACLLGIILDLITLTCGGFVHRSHTVLALSVVEHPIPAETKASAALNRILSWKSSRLRAQPCLFLSFVSRLYFSAGEAGLVLYLCSCSSIGTKAQASRQRASLHSENPRRSH